MERFDHRTATEDEILERAMLLEGMRLGDIPGMTFSSADPRRGRQEVGHAIEAWFGIPPNPSPQPDFPAAGIELKAVPLVATEGGLRVKERTVIALIDYDTIVDETWETASVRKKLRILFVYFEHLPRRPKEEFPIHHIRLWEPHGAVEQQIRRDWELVRDKVRAGLAHELAEADGMIMGPCTKGANRRSLRAQPFSDIPAMSRAFALKPSFTFALYSEPGGEDLSTDELAESASLRALLRRFQSFVGRTVGDVGAELGIPPSRAKSYAASVVHAAVRAASPFDRATFDEIGPTVRMTRVGPNLLPYEALSFPAFRHLELVEEEWEDSTLLALIEHMLIIPVYGPTRCTPATECVIREPIYWRPTAEQLRVIEDEWRTFRDLIAAGRAAELPKASQTRAIHIRPHARDATDRDLTPGGSAQTKKSFWLNRGFVQNILRIHTKPGWGALQQRSRNTATRTGPDGPAPLREEGNRDYRSACPKASRSSEVREDSNVNIGQKPMSASVHSLGEVITGACFRVPHFQRPYAWKEEHVQELWEDLTEPGMLGGDRGAYHFFGTLLTVDPGETSLQGSRLDILDGQQRLTTFTLLLLAIDRELEDLEASEHASAHVRTQSKQARHRIAEAIYRTAPGGQRRLELRPEEDILLANLLQGNPPLRGRLGDAFHTLHSAVRSFCETSRNVSGDLDDLIRVILDRSIVIHARCVYGFDPFAVFSTLNARGLSLTAARKSSGHGASNS